MRKKLLIIGVALVILATTFVYGCGKGVETYNKFGFSFDYPADMKVQEKGYPFFSSEANENYGVVYCRKSDFVICVSWMSSEGMDVDTTHLNKLLDSFLSGQSEGDRIFVAEREESEHMGHILIEQRYVLDEENTLNSIGTWWCNRSKRIFQVYVKRNWENPVYITTGVKVVADAPAPNDDSSYKTYKKVMNSFHCH
jgi:hypothetical protein